MKGWGCQREAVAVQPDRRIEGKEEDTRKLQLMSAVKTNTKEAKGRVVWGSIINIPSWQRHHPCL